MDTRATCFPDAGCRLSQAARTPLRLSSLWNRFCRQFIPRPTMTHHMSAAGLPRVVYRLLAMACMLLLSACSSIPTSRPMAPTVKVESVKAVKLSLSSQELAFNLTVYNPNDYDLPLQSLNFIATVDDTEVARGMSNERVTLPANDEARLQVSVSTRINKLLGRLLRSTSNEETDIPYDIKGFVKLANWPTRIPFNVDGSVDNPALQ